MLEYKKILLNVLENGKERTDRTGTGTLSIRSANFEFDMSKGEFPLLTTKRVSFKNVIGELLWMLNGSSSIYELQRFTFGPCLEEDCKAKRTIWHPNFEKQTKALGYKFGDMGPLYGKQFRHFGEHDIGAAKHTISKVDSKYVDQVAEMLKEAKENPTSRRLLVSLWNPVDIPLMTLPPCHWAHEIYIEDGKLSLTWMQRSVDTLLGLPYNIAFYGMLLLIYCSILDLEPGILEGRLSNVHIYKDHIEQCKEQLSRECRPLPWAVLPDIQSINDLKELYAKDFVLHDYNPHPAIKGKMSA